MMETDHLSLREGVGQFMGETRFSKLRKGFTSF